MALASDGPAPYTSPSAVVSIVDRFRERGLQVPFDLDVLMRAGISEGLAPRTLHALRQLDLIDEAGNPTEALLGLQRATSDEFRDRAAEVIRAAYAPIFQFTDPSEDPPERVRDAFRAYTPTGQQGRMVTLFMGLCEWAGIVGERAKSVTPRPRQAMGKAHKPPKPKKSAEISTPPANALDPAVSGVLFGVTNEDVGSLSDDEFAEVWAALGKVARARSRPKSEIAAPAGEDQQENDEIDKEVTE
jgi:hypothetical protein